MCDTELYILNHIKKVQNKICKLIVALSIRLQEHDKSKLEEPEFSLWKKWMKNQDIRMVLKNIKIK